MKKRLVSLICAGAMMLSSMTAFASGIEISGDVTAVDTVVYTVTVPTAQSALNFRLDPQGVYGYFQANKGANSVTDDDLVSGNYKGKIIGTGAEKFVNLSSVPVAIECEYVMSTTDDDVKLVTSVPGDMATTSSNALYLEMRSVDPAKATDSNADGTEDFGAYSDSGNGKIALATATNATEVTGKGTILLEKADYVFTRATDSNGEEIYSFDPAAVANETYAYLQLGGEVAQNANWVDVSADSIELKCKYTVTGLIQGAGATELNLTLKNGLVDAADVDEVMAESNQQTKGYGAAGSGSGSGSGSGGAVSYEVSTSLNNTTIAAAKGKDLTRVTIYRVTTGDTIEVVSANYQYDKPSGKFTATNSNQLNAQKNGGYFTLYFDGLDPVKVDIK